MAIRDYTLFLKRPLTTKERNRISEWAKQFYTQSRKKLGKKDRSYRTFGIELEHSLLKQDGNLPSFGTAQYIIKTVDSPYLKAEVGSFQIEQNTKPHKLQAGSFEKILREVMKGKKTIADLAIKRKARILSIGITPKYEFNKKIEKEFFSTSRQTKLENLDAPAFRKKPFLLNVLGKKVLKLHTAAEGWAIINSLHIHLQGYNLKDTLRIYNYNQMIMPFMMAISANAGLIKGKQLTKKDYRLNIINWNIDLKYRFDSGFIPHYIKKPDDFFNILLNAKPRVWLTHGKNPTKRGAFESLREELFTYNLLRFDEINSGVIRAEFRPLSIQPTTTENISMLMFYCLLIDYLISKDVPLMDINTVKSDLKNAIIYGIRSSVHFPMNGVIRKYRAYDLLWKLLPKLVKHGRSRGLISKKEMLLLKPLASRAKSRVTPVDRFIEYIEEKNFEKALELMIRLSHYDMYIPYEVEKSLFLKI
ncbi:hypothetical protein JXC34_04595 [Candidatus Woesearchaeota archaeon]|nr:hypothetical protein [Candidatus Woesearchaeota archaeon]